MEMGVGAYGWLGVGEGRSNGKVTKKSMLSKGHVFVRGVFWSSIFL